MDFGAFLTVAVNVLVIPLAVQGIRWIGAKVEETKIGSRSRLDDEVFEALAVGVSNVGNQAGTILEKYDGKLTAQAKADMRDMAVSYAKDILKPKARALLDAMSAEAVDALIRYQVDTQKAQTAAYEARMVAVEQAEHAARELAK